MNAHANANATPRTLDGTPLAGLPETELDQLRATIRTLITTPSADRQAFIRHLATLTADDTTTEAP